MLVDCPKDKCASNSTCEDADRDKVCLVSYDADNNPSCKTEACVQPVGN
jgi:peroxiredoxin